MALLTVMAGCRYRAWLGGKTAASCLIAGFLAGAPPRVAAEAQISAESQIKAVFLFNFAQFLEWPPRAFPEPRAPIVIGVLGDDPFGPFLDGLVQGEKIGERPILVRRYRQAADAGECHILFISRSEAGRISGILSQLKGRSVLTVADMEGFAVRGGMVRFATVNGKIQLRVNVAAARASELTISARLLAHAFIVPGEKD